MDTFRRILAFVILYSCAGGPCDYFYKNGGFTERKFTENCVAVSKLPEGIETMAVESVDSILECVIKCYNLAGCKSIDHMTNAQENNCHLYYWRHVSYCQGNSLIKHYTIVSMTNSKTCKGK